MRAGKDRTDFRRATRAERSTRIGSGLPPLTRARIISASGLVLVSRLLMLPRFMLFSFLWANKLPVFSIVFILHGFSFLVYCRIFLQSVPLTSYRCQSKVNGIPYKLDSA